MVWNFDYSALKSDRQKKNPDSADVFVDWHESRHVLNRVECGMLRLRRHSIMNSWRNFIFQVRVCIDLFNFMVFACSFWFEIIFCLVVLDWLKGMVIEVKGCGYCVLLHKHWQMTLVKWNAFSGIIWPALSLSIWVVGNMFKEKQLFWNFFEKIQVIEGRMWIESRFKISPTIESRACNLLLNIIGSFFH